MLFKESNPLKVGIILFFKDYCDNKKYNFDNAGFLFLDQALGEYDVETKIGSIIFKSFDSEYFKQAKPLSKLDVEFDRYFKLQKIGNEIRN